MNQTRVRAFVYGVIAGTVVLLLGLAWASLRFPGLDAAYIVLARDLVVAGLGHVTAPVAATIAAITVGARAGRVIGLAALAFLAASVGIGLLDYVVTMLFFIPGALESLEGKPDVEQQEIAAARLLRRNIAAYAVGLVTGGAVGAWLGARLGRRRGVV